MTALQLQDLLDALHRRIELAAATGQAVPMAPSELIRIASAVQLALTSSAALDIAAPDAARSARAVATAYALELSSECILRAKAGAPVPIGGQA